MLRWIMVVVTVALVSATTASADTPPVTASAAERDEATSAYTDGRRDRKAWTDWFHGLSIGPYQDGAFWWFSERSKEFPQGMRAAFR